MKYRIPKLLNPGRAVGRAALVLALVSGAAVCGKKEDTKVTPVFSAHVETDQASGRKVIVLERSGQSPMTAKIAPGAGANLFSLIYDGHELLYAPADLNLLPGYRYGTPVLYPAPNRVAKGRFTFEGRTFDWGVNEKDRFLHALVRSVPWEYEEPSAGTGKAEALTYIDFTPGSELHDKFGFDHRLNLRFRLTADGLEIEYEVVNRDSRTIPYGFALHPYFTFLGDRGQVYLCVPARHHMEAVDLMPTGKLVPLDGSPYDLRTPTPVKDLVLDEVYHGMDPLKPAWLEYRKTGIKVTLEASREFTHMVVYAQPQNDFVCVENQTCSTDAHNLYARGLTEAANLLFTPPGGRASGMVRFRVEPLGG